MESDLGERYNQTRESQIMSRRFIRSITAILGAATMVATMASPSVSDPNSAKSSKPKSPPPRIEVKVGKVTRNPDAPGKATYSGHNQKKQS
jgi:poly(3-hydroxybutyrate) depolymerase